MCDRYSLLKYVYLNHLNPKHLYSNANTPPLDLALTGCDEAAAAFESPAAKDVLSFSNLISSATATVAFSID